jgi:flavin-dependent dehydrogenase
MSKGGARVALLDKATFPREKVCGDAVCTPALQILDDMGVMKELVADNQANYADSGGLISPSGLSYIGNSVHQLGSAAACAVKRIHLDEKVARCAARAGADLKENFEVDGDTVFFNKETQLWTVKSTSGQVVTGRVLVCADGSTSYLATKLGYCTEPPLGVSSRAYVKNHNLEADGLCFYPRWSLPGYAAIFKHTNGDLGYCYYLIPSGPNASQGQMGNCTVADLKKLHEEGIRKDPFISRAMGPNPICERMKAASLRLGSQGVAKTYADNLVIIGDAAGHVDPLTGEGIHTAMMGGKCAAEALLQAREFGNFSAVNTKLYENAWKQRFGKDFYWSTAFASAIYRYPILLDAVANEVQRVGDPMMSAWAEIATCMKPKTYFFRPDVGVPLLLALIREIWAQKVVGRPDAYVMPPSENGSTNHSHQNGKSNGTTTAVNGKKTPPANGKMNVYANGSTAAAAAASSTVNGKPN